MNKLFALCGFVLLLGIIAPNAVAYPIAGSVALPDFTTVFPGNTTGASAGTLLASLTEPWSFSTTAGTTSGTLTTAVFLEASGTLDFYYQVSNNATSRTSIGRESNTNFATFLTDVAFRTDGATLGTGFVDGTKSPGTADRLSGVVGFNFNLPVTDEVGPGETSNVLVISTNATRFGPGNSELLDGGSVTVAAFQPTAVPEPTSLALLGSGLIGTFAAIRRKLRK